MERKLRVPFYQRSYAWKKQQVSELFSDIRRAIEEGKSYYFLGSIVGYSVPDSDLVEIVDGQQRLATTTILLAAIRDQLLALKDETSAGTLERDALLRREGFANPTTDPRLILNETD